MSIFEVFQGLTMLITCIALMMSIILSMGMLIVLPISAFEAVEGYYSNSAIIVTWATFLWVLDFAVLTLLLWVGVNIDRWAWISLY